MTESASSDEPGASTPEAVFGLRCRRCRSLLFRSEHLQTHLRSEKTSPCHFGFLVDPMTWMDSQQYSGKINCYKCGEKLGHYVWGGRHCEGEPGRRCQQHVAPWFHVTRERVDRVTSKTETEKATAVPLEKDSREG